MGTQAVGGRPPADRLFTRDFRLLLGGVFGLGASMALPLAVMPLFVVQLGGREADVGLAMALFGIGAAASRPVVGWQLDRGGRVPVLVVAGMAVVASAAGYALLGALGGALLLLYPLRLVHGVGMASQFAAGQVLASELASARRRGEAVGWQSAAMSACAALAPPAGFALLGVLGAPGVFAAAAGVAALGLMLLARIREPPRPPAPGRGRFFHPAAVKPGLVLIGVYGTLSSVFTFTPIYAVGHGLENPGLFFTAYSGASVAGQAVGGKAADRAARVPAVAAGLLLGAVGVALVPMTAGAALLACALLVGFGLALAQPGLISEVMDRGTRAERGALLATSGLFLEAGVAAGPALVGAVADRAGLELAFRVMALGPAISCAGLLLLRWLSPAPRLEDEAGAG